MNTDFFLFSFAIVLAFYMAWNMGANDVANAMGTSVGSGALSLKRALLVAGCLEFTGAFLAGSEVSHTIESGILNGWFFQDQPYIVIKGMLSSLLATGIWLQIASYYGWPVSTTHSLIGALVGFGLVTGGSQAIQWNSVISIVLSWLVSPLIGGALGYIIFSIIRICVLSRKNPLQKAIRLCPYFYFIVVSLLSLVMLAHSIKYLHDYLNFSQAFFISLLLGVSSATLARLVYKKQLKISLRTNISSEMYVSVEKLFVMLQILSACCMAFAHGANDVANAIGPLASIFYILKFQQLPQSAPIAPWILALGGLGIVIGLATWGWRVIDTIGKKLTELTPSRGFAAEFAAATTILLASKLGMPISTTHTLVGAVLGVGLARGIDALNLGMIRDICSSWIVTVPAGAILSMGFFFLMNWLF